MTQETGSEIIRKYLQDMPSSAGVYRMLDAAGNALYVGKAKNLKNRVANYVSSSGLSNRIMKMISLTASMEIVTTAGEAEALLLESNLIKKLKPRYNILLRDDKTFPYILLTGDGDFPQICKHRGSRDQKGEYFGPFASAGAVNQTLALLQKVFLLRPCSDNIFKNRKRPCLQYQIKRCSAPCVDYISKEEYAESVHQASLFLHGKNREIQEKLAEQMQQASVAMEYDKAAVFRDRIAALTRIQHEQNIIAGTLQDADIIALYREGENSAIQVFFFRGGQNFGNKSYFPTHTQDASESDILAAFIGQFYDSQIPPRQIIVSHEVQDADLIVEALAINNGKIEIILPQRGEKKQVLERAVINAKDALLRHISEHAGNAKLLEQVGKLFAIGKIPERIEVYDNSHIAGSYMVGAMICAGKEGFIKNNYRRFNINKNELVGGDDYAMLKQVLTRRFSRLQKEDAVMPDLVLIDGGAGQLSVAIQVFHDLGISNLTFVAIAKGVDRNAGREWLHMPGQQPFQLPKDDQVLHYLQRLRDEAHRFAIGSHRIKRSNAIRESTLDQIEGVGASRKRALLKHFGSSREVEAATLQELEKVVGIDKKTAAKIYGFFHP